MKKIIFGKIIDIENRKIFNGKLELADEKITKMVQVQERIEGPYILPGLIDAHIHIESSMLTPSGFARMAVSHGTVAAVSDPHEIANVMGVKGLEYMIEDGKQTPFKFFFGAPSCVPATPFESAGATINADEIEALLQRNDIKYLSEMMNFPGVISGDVEVTRKIKAAKKNWKPIDGHAPGLKGESLRKYISAGISTDHECSTLKEAEEKLKQEMLIQIREGSAAKNFMALYPLLKSQRGKVMLCSDDLHPDDLYKGHINLLIKKGLQLGISIFDLLEAATAVPVRHYGLEVGLLKPGDPGDFILIDHPNTFNIVETWINGKKVYDGKSVLFNPAPIKKMNHFNAGLIKESDIKIPAQNKKIRVIVAKDGELLTEEMHAEACTNNNETIANSKKDMAKIVVVNRYKKAKPSVGFITGFGLNPGALAASIAHDSHNLIAIGTNDRDMVNVLNALIKAKGGIALTDREQIEILPLEVAGLMSTQPAIKVAKAYESINNKAAGLCKNMKSPFMTLSFMALLVIPKLKIGDRGLFDVTRFANTSLFVS